MSYGENLDDFFPPLRIVCGQDLQRRQAPGDLPIEQPTKFDLMLNLKMAKALDLAIPPSLLALADEVIE